MFEYKLKPGKVGKAVIGTYKTIEEKFTDTFLKEDEGNESGYDLKTGKTADAVVSAYKKIENGVIGGYKKIENGAVGGYKKIEEAFVDAFLEKTNSDDRTHE